MAFLNIYGQTFLFRKNLTKVHVSNNSNNSGLHSKVTGILNHVTNPTYKVNVTKEPYVTELLRDSKSYCDGNFVGYKKVLAKFKNVIINPQYGTGRRGGENIMDVINQKENDEYYDLSQGFFSLRCSEDISYQFYEKSYLNQWIKALKPTDVLPNPKFIVPTWTVAIKRYEYANLYLTMADFYNVYLVTKMFDLDPNNTNVLWVDGHPVGALDTTWDVLFGEIKRVGELEQTVLFQSLVWGIMGYDSIYHQFNLPTIPYLEDFRDFFLTQHGIDPEKELQCNNLKILFLWRRDYLAHPRNPQGHVERKIQNEDELLARAKELLPGHIIEGNQIDKYLMRDQLDIISHTDILIGMHGAGLTHALFLPRKAGLIELFPAYKPSQYTHFREMSRWRNQYYAMWRNTDRKKELPDHYTIVDVNAVMKMLLEARDYLCQKEDGNHSGNEFTNLS